MVREGLRAGVPAATGDSMFPRPRIFPTQQPISCPVQILHSCLREIIWRYWVILFHVKCTFSQTRRRTIQKLPLIITIAYAVSVPLSPLPPFIRRRDRAVTVLLPQLGAFYTHEAQFTLVRWYHQRCVVAPECLTDPMDLCGIEDLKDADMFRVLQWIGFASPSGAVKDRSWTA